MITTANDLNVANDIVATIGETPLVRLDKLFPDSKASFLENWRPPILQEA